MFLKISYGIMYESVVLDSLKTPVSGFGSDKSKPGMAFSAKVDMQAVYFFDYSQRRIRFRLS